MVRSASPMPIVVGIDGSDAAIAAAQWAVDEALSRDLTLRLVHVIEPGSEAVRLEDECAEIALRAARSAVETRSAQVRVETAIRRGNIDATLAKESRNAELICIGSPSRVAAEESDECDGDGDGGTATALARSAGCALAVVGSNDGREDRTSGCVAVVVDGSNVNDAILEDALSAAELRGSPLLVLVVGSPAALDGGWDTLEQRLGRGRAKHPDVTVHCMAMHTDAIAFLADIAPSIAMTIVDGSEPLRRARLVQGGVDSTQLARSAAQEYDPSESDSIAPLPVSGPTYSTSR